MIKEVLDYMDAGDKDLVDFTRRLRLLAQEGLISANELHHVIDLMSLRHIVHSRSHSNNLGGVAGNLQLHLSSTFDDLEVWEHFEAGRLAIQDENTELSVLAKRLLHLQRDIRTLGSQLVSKLTNRSARSDVKRVRKRLETLQAERNTHLNAFAGAISDKVLSKSLGHGVSEIVGVPTVLYGFWENAAQRGNYLAWRDGLSPKKIEKLRKALKRKPIPLIGRRSSSQIKLMFLEDDFVPVFRVDPPSIDDIEGYVPYQAISTLYFSLYERWWKAHLKYENKLFCDDSGINLTLFRKRLNVPLPPSFLTPRQMLHNLVAHIIQASEK